MDMKKLLNIVSGEKEKTQINESLNECGAMGMQPNMPPPTPPVSMNVSLNAQGIDQIKDLLNLMNKADSPLAPGAVSAPMPPLPMPTMGMDQPIAIKAQPEPEEKDMGVDALDDLVKKAGISMKAADEKPEGPGAAKGGDEAGTKSPLSKMADEVQDMADTLAIVNKKEGYANEPDEKMGDMDDAVPSGDDLHRKKTMYKATQPGDNPMATEALKSTLMKLYKEMKEGKKAKPDFLDMDKDGNKTEPMKKAVADKKVKEADDRKPAKQKEREVTLPSGAKVKSRTVQGWQSQKADKSADKERKDSYKD